MKTASSSSTLRRVAVWIALVAAAGPLQAQDSDLGTIAMANSGAPEAQAPFLRGVAALHSFWYEEAADAFRRAQEVDPDFALAYWGEAMTYNHPLWAQQDIAAARRTLRRLAPSRKQRMAKAMTPLEKAYLQSLEILYGEGEKLERDLAYSEFFERLYERHPDDHEIACFYALSLLGTVRPGDTGFGRQMKAAAILLDVFEENPDHPGAAHYIIHSFDDPEHAPLALDAADKYAEIAPAAPHALHMPSHIYVQLGMWDGVAASNEAAYRASDAWVKRKKLSITKRDYHAFSWAQYAYLQQGRYRDAWTPVDVVRRVAEETGAELMRRYHGEMKARYIIETERWEAVPLPDAAAFGGHRYDATPSVLLAAGMSAARTGRLDDAREAVDWLRALGDEKVAAGQHYDAKELNILENEVAALIAFREGDTPTSLRLLEEAATLEAGIDPPSGPPYPVIKPSHELYGEVLLKAGQAQAAIEQFEIALQRMPGRARSLLGLARAAARAGDTAARRHAYRSLGKHWRGADRELAERDEIERALVPDATRNDES